MLENDQNLNTTGTIVLHPGKPFFVANQSFWVKFQLYETNISASYGLKPLQSGGSQKQQLSSLLNSGLAYSQILKNLLDILNLELVASEKFIIRRSC